MVGLITKNILKILEYPKKTNELASPEVSFSHLETFRIGFIQLWWLGLQRLHFTPKWSLGHIFANFRGKLYQCVQQLCLQLPTKRKI